MILRIIEVNSVVVASIHLPGMSSRLYQLSCSTLPRPPWPGTGEPKRETTLSASANCGDLWFHGLHTD
jgi:hypothetical protein